MKRPAAVALPAAPASAARAAGPCRPAYARGSERAVVILPGVYETWHFLRPIADELNRRGHPVHVMHAHGLQPGSDPGDRGAGRP